MIYFNTVMKVFLSELIQENTVGGGQSIADIRAGYSSSSNRIRYRCLCLSVSNTGRYDVTLIFLD